MPQPVVIEAHICNQRRSYKVIFEGTDAEVDTNLAAFIAARTQTTVVMDYDPDNATILSRQLPLTEALLFPTCVHGLSERLCEGPGHYMSYDQERERFGY